VANTVYVERRSALHTTAFSGCQVTLDPEADLRRGAVAVELVGFQSQVDRVLVEVGVLECLLVLEQILVHGPKVALCASRFGRFRGYSSMRVDLCQREMPEHKAQRLRVLTLQHLNATARQAGVRTFVVTILEQRYRGLRWTLDVVILCNWRGQPRDYPGHEREAAKRDRKRGSGNPSPELAWSFVVI
jgi:hypothetical protein